MTARDTSGRFVRAPEDTVDPHPELAEDLERLPHPLMAALHRHAPALLPDKRFADPFVGPFSYCETCGCVPTTLLGPVAEGLKVGDRVRIKLPERPFAVAKRPWRRRLGDWLRARKR